MCARPCTGRPLVARRPMRLFVAAPFPAPAFVLMVHPLDLAVVLAYLVAIFFLARRSTRRAAATEEGYLLAGRKLGKLYQFFLNFGNSTDANGAVSTSSVVYQHGMSGVWLAFQVIFLNPYYWFMNLWFRRVRLVTTADLFEERLGSRGLARFYAIFQIVSATVIAIGFGNLVSYKVVASLVPEAMPAWAFYVAYTLVVGGYVVAGGLTATAMNEIIQGLLTLVFSAMLIPLGLAALGGPQGLAERVPAPMFELIGSGGASPQFTLAVLLGILANTLVQMNGIPGNMTISGSARDEYAARFGAVSGTFAKRLLTIMWAFSGLIAVALFQGRDALSDPDAAWGALSRMLLGPGLLGLMLVGLLANSMDTAAAQSLSLAGLFVSNIYQPLRRGRAGERECVAAGRAAVVGVLGLGIVAALSMRDVFSMLQFMMTVNVPFGAAVMLMFFWRRLTAPAVWTAVTVAVLFNTLSPVLLPRLDAIRAHPGLTTMIAPAGGKPVPLYFDAVGPERPDDPASRRVGRGRFHVELAVLRAVGVDVAAMSSGNRYAVRLFVAALTPFALLLLVSLVTRPPARDRVDLFFGKMKTPVAATPELDQAEMAATARDPRRFDRTKLFPRSSWEFTRWTRVDTLGFLACCAVSGSILGLFWGLLRLAAP